MSPSLRCANHGNTHWEAVQPQESEELLHVTAWKSLQQKVKESGTEGHPAHDAAYRRCPDQANPDTGCTLAPEGGVRQKPRRGYAGLRGAMGTPCGDRTPLRMS